MGDKGKGKRGGGKKRREKRRRGRERKKKGRKEGEEGRKKGQAKKHEPGGCTELQSTMPTIIAMSKTAAIADKIIFLVFVNFFIVFSLF